MNPYEHLINSKKKLVLLILILGGITTIGPFSIDMYLPAFAAMAKSFDAPESLIQLSLTSYFVGVALSQLLYGPIVDRFGRKIPLFGGLIIFLLASIACYFAKDPYDLIFFRFFQAVGACAGMTIPRTIIRDIFSPQESARMFSHLILVMGVAPIIAPVVGGFLVLHFSWKAIFGFLIIFGILALISAYFFLPETKGSNKDDKISHALKKYSGILNDKNFVIHALSGGLVMAAMFSYITGSPFIYTEFFKILPQEYGMIFGVNAFGFILASQINAQLLKRFSVETVLEKILFVPAILGIILVGISFNNPNFWIFTIVLFFLLASVGMILPGATAMALANQSKHTGSASAMLGTIQFTIAAFTSFAVGKFNDGSALPMALIIAACGILALVIFQLGARHHSRLNDLPN